MSGQSHLFIADPEANYALAKGEFKKARDTYFVIFEADPGQPEYAYRAARASLWARDAADANALLATAVGTGAFGVVQDARLNTIRAGIAAIEGRTAEALALYRDALRGWRETHSVWDEAMTGVDMGELLDPAEPEVAAAINASRAILERLDAKPYLERLNAAAARRPERSASARPTLQTEAALTD
jgi:hypothetical protein